MKRVLVVGQSLADKITSVVIALNESYSLTEAICFTSANDILNVDKTFDAIVLGGRQSSGCTISFTSELRSRGHDKIIVLHDGDGLNKHSPDSTVAMLDVLGANVLVGRHYDEDLSASLDQVLAA